MQKAPSKRLITPLGEFLCLDSDVGCQIQQVDGSDGALLGAFAAAGAFVGINEHQTLAQKLSTVTAPLSQALTHFMQPMQPAVHSLRVTAPLS